MKLKFLGFALLAVSRLRRVLYVRQRFENARL